MQLESALKAVESAQASLNAERQSSKALLLTEEEIKSLQLQVKFNIFLGSFRSPFYVLRKLANHQRNTVFAALFSSSCSI